MNDGAQPTINDGQDELDQRKATVSKKEVDRHYSALMDSVNFINRLLKIKSDASDEMGEEEIKDHVQRNLSHLKIMLARPFWGERSMAEVENCIKAAEEAYPPNAS
jgi:hypothetical protein